VNDPDRAFIWPPGMDGDLPDRLWVDEVPGWGEERSAADVTAGLVSMAFIRAALRRGAKFWCATAVLGLLIGSALYVKYPPADHATASVLVVQYPGQDPAVEVQTDVSLASSQAVAARVVQQLGLHQTVASFQASYTVTAITDTVLTLNVGAPSSAEAVRRVSALAEAFLQYRARYMRAQEQQLVTDLDQQFSAAQQQLNSINAQISQLSSAHPSPDQQTEINNLEGQRGNQAQIEEYVTGAKATAKTTTDAVVANSQLLNSATALPRSRTKGPALYVGGGLLGGLAAGMAIVIVSALVSDRLRRRGDVADALGAPVRLSVGSLRRGRLPTLPWRAHKRNHDMRRVVTYLRSAVPGSSRGPAGLAVVAVDDVDVAMRAVAAVAGSYAGEDKQVVVADLSDGARLARLLSVRQPGVRTVTWNGTQLVVVLPDPDDMAPVGPMNGAVSPMTAAPAPEAVISACTSADLVLTLVTLDPAFGGDHLATWATDAVAVVTAGESSAVRLHAVGEMLRLAGMRLDSAVLIGADKDDESLGVAPAPDEPAPVRPV
jgi:capsular polysaccharide biosynthesis protein